MDPLFGPPTRVYGSDGGFPAQVAPDRSTLEGLAPAVAPSPYVDRMEAFSKAPEGL
jgi:hypothetical protein